MRQVLTRAIPIGALLGVVAACAAPAASPTPAAPTETPQPTPTLSPASQFATRVATLGARVATPVPAGRIIGAREITSAALANNLIGDPATRYFDVYLPPGYDTGDNRYPVVYMLQGYGGGIWFTAVAATLDQLIDAGEAREMILVFFRGANRFGGSWYTSSPTIGDYETFIAEELVSLVDSSYRTLPDRESRGITGCSMGGYGSFHLALKRPDVFGVAAPMSGYGAPWLASMFEFTLEPRSFDEFYALPSDTRMLISAAAAAAPNPNNPPFYLDMPFEFLDGQPQIVPEVLQRINTVLDPASDLPGYLDQPIRLNGLLIFQDTNNDPDSPDMEATRAFDRTLTALGVGHEYLEAEACHCCADWGPIMEFMSTHLAY